MVAGRRPRNRRNMLYFPNRPLGGRKLCLLRRGRGPPWAPWLPRDQSLGDRDRYDAAFPGNAADHDRLVEVVAPAIHFDRESARRRDLAAGERGPDLIDLDGAGRLDRGAP